MAPMSSISSCPSFRKKPPKCQNRGMTPEHHTSILAPFSSLLSWSKQAASLRQIMLPRAPIFLPPAPPGSLPAPRRR